MEKRKYLDGQQEQCKGIRGRKEEYKDQEKEGSVKESRRRKNTKIRRKEKYKDQEKELRI